MSRASALPSAMAIYDHDAATSSQPPKSARSNRKDQQSRQDNTAPSEDACATDLFRDQLSWNRFNVLNVLGFVLNLVFTYGFGTAGWAQRPTNAELSQKYATLITPGPTAFAIWSVIFFVQALWVVWQCVRPSQRHHMAVVQAVGYRYAVVCVLQVAWTLSFTWEVEWLALVWMLMLLTTLWWILFRIHYQVEKKWKGYFVWQFPFSLHGGWILVASVVNINVVLVAYGAAESAQLIVAVVSLIALLISAKAVLSGYPVDFTPPLVLIWALFWIYSELNDPPLSIQQRFTESQITGLQTGALAGGAFLLAVVALKIVYIMAFARQHDDNGSGEDAFFVHPYRSTMISQPISCNGGAGVEDANHVTDEDHATGRSTSMHDDDDDKIIVEIWEGK